MLKGVRNFTGPCPGPNREKCTVLSSLYSVVAATLSFSQKFSDSMWCLLWRIKCWGGRRDTQSLFSPLTDDVEVGPPGRSASLSSLRLLRATARRPGWWERKNLRWWDSANLCWRLSSRVRWWQVWVKLWFLCLQPTVDPPGRLPPVLTALVSRGPALTAAPRAGEVVEVVEAVEAVRGAPRSAVTAQCRCLTETERPRPAVTAPDLSAPWLSARPQL